MWLASVLDSVVAATTLTLRITAYLFVRHHPLGPRYLHRIYWNAALYALVTLMQLAYVKRSSIRTRRSKILIPLLGLVDARRPFLSLSGVILNILALGAPVDFVYRGHVFHQSTGLSFSRLGYVDSTTARVVVRAPASNPEQDDVVHVQLNVSETFSGAEAWARVVAVTADEDYVGTFVVEGLRPDTAYRYETNTSDPHVEGVIRTKPVADAEPKVWSLVATSCLKPFYPYSPLDHGLRVPGLEHLDRYLSTTHPAAVELMLFLGDFIYIDLPLPLGWTREAYTAAYRQTYASPSWTRRLRDLPWVHVYDDHEIRNDWAGNNETGPLWSAAMVPFRVYQGRANPPSRFGDGETYFTLERGGVSFFVLDTRRYRSSEERKDRPGKSMLGEKQLGDLKAWLGDGGGWKVVVSSVPFTRNWRGPDSGDSWAGYLWERDQILDVMKGSGGAVILSGDRHEHATTLFPAKRDGDKPVIEFSTSPLNQFFEPFDRFHMEVEDTDISIHSHPWGNSKFGVVTFDTATEGELLVHYDLIVDGRKVWEYDWKAFKD